MASSHLAATSCFRARSNFLPRFSPSISPPSLVHARAAPANLRTCAKFEKFEGPDSVGDEGDDTRQLEEVVTQQQQEEDDRSFNHYTSQDYHLLLINSFF